MVTSHFFPGESQVFVGEIPIFVDEIPLQKCSSCAAVFSPLTDAQAFGATGADGRCGRAGGVVAMDPAGWIWMG